MKTYSTPTLRTHVHNAGHAFQLKRYIDAGGFFANADEATSPAGKKAAEAHASIECRRSVSMEEARKRERERGKLFGKWCVCCKTQLVDSVDSANSANSYCKFCRSDLQKTTYHLKKAFSLKRPESVCMLCRRVSKIIVLEHCHKTGHARGWVCNRCNATLGLVEKDVAAFQRYCLARFGQSV